MSIEFIGYDAIMTKLSDLYDAKGVKTGVSKACALVEREAKQKAPKASGNLRRSITSKVTDGGMTVEGEVYTPCEYAPYVEFGTGLYAEAGNGRKTGWAFKDEKTGETIWTHGQHPQPYMRPALNENREKAIALIKEGLISD